jgi:rod shape-determining protein MreD
MQAAQPQEILLPVKIGFVTVTLAAALLLNLIQWGGLMRWVKPDFCALVLLYWGIHQPRRIGFAVAWLLGLAMDIADASLFGQHALAYTLLLYGAIMLHRRVLRFGVVHQVLHVLPLLLATDLLILLLRVSAGAEFPGWRYFGASLVGAALWAPVSFLFRIPQVPKSDPNTGVHVP